MFNPIKFFATGKDQPVIQDQKIVDQLYRKQRFRIMIAITVGYGIAYTCVE